MNPDQPRILLSGGGTGGHIYPAIAIAEAIRKQCSEARILFAGAKDRIEWNAVPKAGFEIEPIWISGMQRRFTLSNALVPLKLLISLWQSFRIIRRFKPDAVVCTGGYVSGPVGWVASKMGLPVFLQEQNSFPGVTTRLLAPSARLVFTAFPQAKQFLKVSDEKVVLAGNPARSSISASGGTSGSVGGKPVEKQNPSLLVLGGSGGAQAINDAMLSNLDTLHHEMKVRIVWQCGPKYLEGIRSKLDSDSYSRLALTAFIDDMAKAYRDADVVLTRAGAGICTEVMIAGKPAVLMPSPHVAGDHQTKNAEAMTSAGAAVLLKDDDAIKELPALLGSLLKDAKRLKKMSMAALALARPDAAAEIASAILAELGVSQPFLEHKIVKAEAEAGALSDSSNGKSRYSEMKEIPNHSRAAV